MPGMYNSSSIEGGIFGANPVQIPKIKIGQMGENNSSSVKGGIFAEPAAFQATPRTSQLTYSSVQGGIFADAPTRSSPDMRPKTGIRHTVTEEDAVAGKKLERDTQSALQPLKTSRTNTNSIQDGIFSKEAPTPVKHQRAATYNHNQSSVQGGIFGC